MGEVKLKMGLGKICNDENEREKGKMTFKYGKIQICAKLNFFFLLLKPNGIKRDKQMGCSHSSQNSSYFNCQLTSQQRDNASPMPSASLVHLSAGSLVSGRWTIVKKLGAGQFGTVYMCKDNDGRQAALKAEPIVKDVSSSTKQEVAVQHYSVSSWH